MHKWTNAYKRKAKTRKMRMSKQYLKLAKQRSIMEKALIHSMSTNTSATNQALHKIILCLQQQQLKHLSSIKLKRNSQRESKI